MGSSSASSGNSVHLPTLCYDVDANLPETLEKEEGADLGVDEELHAPHGTLAPKYDGESDTEFMDHETTNYTSCDGHEQHADKSAADRRGADVRKNRLAEEFTLVEGLPNGRQSRGSDRLRESLRRSPIESRHGTEWAKASGRDKLTLGLKVPSKS